VTLFIHLEDSEELRFPIDEFLAADSISVKDLYISLSALTIDLTVIFNKKREILLSLLKYLIQYRFNHMGEMIRNSRKSPLSCNESLEGKTVLITGATSGIGLETARLFAGLGANLIFVNRDVNKSEKLEGELKEDFGVETKTILADFSSLDQLKECTDQLLRLDEPIDVLIHNAGVFNTKKKMTGDGIEMVFQVNHLAAFYLNYRLKERLKKENRARIIYVNSEGHRFALTGVHLNDLGWRRHIYTGLKSYGAAKTAQLLTMKRFAEYFSGCDVTINAMHPGNVRSNMGNNNGPVYMWLKRKLVLASALDPRTSAQALHYLSAAKELSGVSGKYFHLTTEERPAPHAIDESRVDTLWNKSLKLCRLE